MNSIVFFRYQTEFGFKLPNRAIVVDDIRIRGTGKAFEEDDEELPPGKNPAKVEAVSLLLSSRSVF